MKITLSKQKYPVLLLLFMVASWPYFYTGSHWLNGYGSDKKEWLLMIDIFITMPLVCYFCLREKPKEALIKSLAYMSLLILLGSYVIPSKDKYLWLYLENLRFVALVLVVLFELFIISTVVSAIRSAFMHNQDPDLAISEPIEKMIGKSVEKSVLFALMQFDIRLWTFVLFPKKIKSENYQGSQHFYCHLKDGTQSFLQGFVFLIIFEIPIIHVLLHFIWSPIAANIITALTVFSLAYFIAEYRAFGKRPISITSDHLIIRYGLKNPVMIPLDEIKEIKPNKQVINRNPSVKRFNMIGVPNVEIILKDNTTQSFNRIYLGLNNPQKFIQTIKIGTKIGVKTLV